MIDLYGSQNSNLILALAGATFVVPFLLFASLAGTLADRYSKRTIITITRLTEIGVMICGVIAFSLESPLLGYGVLFLMAFQTTLFSPCKYGILPEIVPPKKISYFNGLIAATTFLAIILGTFLASFLTDITHKQFIVASWVCVVIALFGALFSFGIEKTKPQASQKKISRHFLKEVYLTLKKATRTRYLLLSILFGAYFLFIGAFVQLNIIPFTVQSLHHTEVQGGYLFLMTALGIGIGSFFAGKISGEQIELGFVPFATFGMALMLWLLHHYCCQLYPVAAILAILGLFGGFFIVPITAFIQVGSVNEDRGENVAVSNFISFFGVIVASFLIWYFGSYLNLTAADGFFIISLATLVMGVCLLGLMADQVLRLALSLLAQSFWKLHLHGKKILHQSTPQLIVVHRTSWLDTVIMMALLPRLMRYVVPVKGRFFKSRRTLLKTLSILAIDAEHYAPHALEQVKTELALGRSVCFMVPAFTKKWETSLEELDVSFVTATIERTLPAKQAGYFSQFLSLFHHPLKITFAKTL